MRQHGRRFEAGIAAAIMLMSAPAAGAQAAYGAAQTGEDALQALQTAGYGVVQTTDRMMMQTAGRETDFFEEREHTEISYGEIEASYYHYDPAEFMEELEELEDLAAQEGNGQAVLEQYRSVTEEYVEALTLVYVASNASQRDVTDAQWAEEYVYAGSIATQMLDTLCMTVRDVLSEPSGEVLAEALGEELAGEFLEYEGMTEEQLAYSERESELILEYYTRQTQAPLLTVSVNGTDMNQDELTTAYLEGALDNPTFLAAATQLEREQNEFLGEIYLDLTELRKESAELAGYENYGDLMYESYGRDYTQESIQEFADAVKEYLTGPYTLLQYLMDPTADCLNRDYPCQEVFEIMGEVLPGISEELDESFRYLLRNEMYDLDYSETKTAGAYTAPLIEYGSAFIYMQPNGNAYDFSGSLIHEFGHFNAFYHNEMEWYESLVLDIAEVHSQGLEVLFLNEYDSIFGTEAQTMREFVMINLLAACVQGCMVNELETYVYATEDVTLEQINRKYLELAKEYGLVDASYPAEELYTWCNIPHLYQSPCYYISYATSVAAAFEIWELSLQDYEEAADAYLLFTSLGFESGYLDTLEQAGLGNPLDSESVEEIGTALTEYFDLEERIGELFGGGEGTESGEGSAGEPTEGSGEESEMTPEESTEGTDSGDEEMEDAGEGEAAEEAGAGALEEEQIYAQCYVRSGDTLSEIGQRCQTDWREIASLNEIEAPYRIDAGERLLLPEDAVIPTETYTVQAGDTLGKIAAKLGMDWRILAEQLGMEAPYTIYAGEVLTFTY